MNIIYCILAYNDPELLARFVNKLNYENSKFLIHVQKSVDISAFKKYLPESYFINDNERIETIWGDISCVEAAILLFKKAIQLYGTGQILLVSGSDYPVKSSRYIENYLVSQAPMNYYAQVDFKELNNNLYKKMAIENRDNWWISFEKSKCKIEIKPLHYIRIRCIHKIKDIPFFLIFQKIPTIIKLFFSKSKFAEEFKDLKWVISETWMELSSESVIKLLTWLDKHPKYLKLGKYCHNPEEMLLQSVLSTIENDIPRKNYLVNCEARNIHNGSLELENEDWTFILDRINNKDWLFMRKFNSVKNKEMLDRIDAFIKKSGL